MSKFFNEIVAPLLTQTDYGQGIESMVNNINANFQKVFTLPFLKGDDGDRLTTRFCPFWDSSDPNTAKLTEEGYKIFEAIFIDEKIKNGIEFKNTKPGCTLENLMDDLAKLFTESENSGEDLFRQTYGPAGNPKILLYYQIDTESNNETLLGAAQLYYFFDPRVQGLSDFIGTNDTTTVEGFVDYTCILSTKYVNGDLEYSYEYEKQSGWPTLYFDSSSKQFCWQINGQKTGVNAQGVNGRDGRGSKIWLCVVKPIVTTEAGQTMSTNVEYSKGKYTKFEIIDIWIPKVNGWLNINDKNGYDRALNALGESGLPSSGDVFIAYLYSESEQSIKVPVYTIENGELVDSGETEIFSKPPMSIYGTLFYDAQAEDSKKYYVFSNISQNLYRTTDNTVLVDMLNHIGDYTGDNSSTSNGVQDPMCVIKGLFVPLRGGETEGDTHEYVHVLYNNRDNGSLNLKVDALANVTDIHESHTDVKVNKEKQNLNIIYNTNVDGILNVTGSTTLVGKKNPGAEKDLVNNLSNFPLVIDTQKEDNKLIIGPQDLYAIDKSGNPITFCINQKPEAEVIIGNNILTVKDKEVYISLEAHKSPGTKGKYGTSFNEGITLYASYTNDNLAYNIPCLVLKTSSKYDGDYDKTHKLFEPGVGDSPFVIKRGLTVEGASTLGGKITVSSGGASITGATTIQYASDGNKIVVNSRGTNITGDATITGATTIRSSADNLANKIVINANGTFVVGKTTIESASNGNKIAVDSNGTTVTGTTTLNGTATLNKAVTLNWNESNYYNGDTTTSTLLAKSLLNIGGEGYLRVIFSRNSIQGLSNTKDGEHYKTNTLNINPLGGVVNIGDSLTAGNINSSSEYSIKVTNSNNTKGVGLCVHGNKGLYDYDSGTSGKWIISNNSDGNTIIPSKLHVGGTTYQSSHALQVSGGGVCIKGTGTAQDEYSNDLSKILSTTTGYIYMGAEPYDTSRVNKMVINRHAILAYTTYNTANQNTAVVSSLYLNPAGGSVGIGGDLVLSSNGTPGAVKSDRYYNLNGLSVISTCDDPSGWTCNPDTGTVIVGHVSNDTLLRCKNNVIFGNSGNNDNIKIDFAMSDTIDNVCGDLKTNYWGTITKTNNSSKGFYALTMAQDIDDGDGDDWSNDGDNQKKCSKTKSLTYLTKYTSRGSSANINIKKMDYKVYLYFKNTDSAGSSTLTTTITVNKVKFYLTKEGDTSGTKISEKEIAITGAESSSSASRGNSNTTTVNFTVGELNFNMTGLLDGTQYNLNLSVEYVIKIKRSTSGVYWSSYEIGDLKIEVPDASILFQLQYDVVASDKPYTIITKYGIISGNNLGNAWGLLTLSGGEPTLYRFYKEDGNFKYKSKTVNSIVSNLW